MSQIYKIIRWDPMLNNNNTSPKPIISIKPDKNFYIFTKENKNILLVKFSKTNTIYDHKSIIGLVDSQNPLSLDTIPIILNTEWNGYPECNGECEIFGLKGGMSSHTINDIKLKTIPMAYRYMPYSMSQYTIIAILSGILVIFLLTLLLVKK